MCAPVQRWYRLLHTHQGRTYLRPQVCFSIHICQISGTAASTMCIVSCDAHSNSHTRNYACCYFEWWYYNCCAIAHFFTTVCVVFHTTSLSPSLSIDAIHQILRMISRCAATAAFRLTVYFRFDSFCIHSAARKNVTTSSRTTHFYTQSIFSMKIFPGPFK